MRIVGGRFRGRRLASVGSGDKAAHLRPTSDRVRESIFNVLSGGALPEAVQGARVLDLFAGTGALGLEALSRGAREALFVDKGRKSSALINENIRLLGVEQRARFLQNDATRLGRCPAAPSTLVFLDPPYGKGLGQRALAAAVKGGWMEAGALVVWEEGCELEPPLNFEILDRRRYGDTHVAFLRYRP